MITTVLSGSYRKMLTIGLLGLVIGCSDPLARPSLTKEECIKKFFPELSGLSSAEVTCCYRGFVGGSTAIAVISGSEDLAKSGILDRIRGKGKPLGDSEMGAELLAKRIGDAGCKELQSGPLLSGRESFNLYVNESNPTSPETFIGSSEKTLVLVSFEQ
jgi:hypothetical protein